MWKSNIHGAFVLNCHVNLTPSTRRLLDGVAVWVLYHSIQSSPHPTHWLSCAQAWWVAEAHASNRDAFAAQAAGLWRPTPRAIARVVLGGAALERGAAKAPEAGVIACVEVARAFGGDVRPIDGAHLALQEKIFGAQQPPPSS